jgi:hypothetical protein
MANFPGQSTSRWLIRRQSMPSTASPGSVLSSRSVALVTAAKPPHDFNIEVIQSRFNLHH